MKKLEMLGLCVYIWFLENEVRGGRRGREYLRIWLSMVVVKGDRKG